MENIKIKSILREEINKLINEELNYFSVLDKTIEELLTELSKDIDIHIAGTGSIYASYNGNRIRISNHEPNFSSHFHSFDYKEYYVQDYKYIEDLIIDIAEYFNITITGKLKQDIDIFCNWIYNQSDYSLKTKKEYKESINNRNEYLKILKLKINDKKEEIKSIINYVNNATDNITNGDKRRKRRRKLFKEIFKEKFGFEAELSDVTEVIK